MTETKKIKGRKRHIIVDSLGNLLYVKVHPANIHDTIAGIEVMTGALKDYPGRLSKDFERLVKYAETWIRISMISLMLNKIEAAPVL